MADAVPTRHASNKQHVKKKEEERFAIINNPAQVVAVMPHCITATVIWYRHVFGLNLLSNKNITC
jgi:hypothetical protein